MIFCIFEIHNAVQICILISGDNSKAQELISAQILGSRLEFRTEFGTTGTRLELNTPYYLLPGPAGGFRE